MARAKKIDSKLDLQLQIEYVDIGLIKPYFNNPKNHSDKQVDQLANIIKNGGFDVPMVVDENYVLIKGHKRRLASLKLELKKVPIIVRRDLSEEEKKAMRISDNKTSESPWDEDPLIEELAQLQEAGFDLALTGFEEEEWQALFKKMQEEETEYQSGQIFGLNSDTTGTNTIPTDNQNIDEENLSKTKHKCPSCGFQW